MNTLDKIIIVLAVLFHVFCISLFFLHSTNELNGIENYNKEYLIQEYHYDLDSNLSIFPDNTSSFIDPTFKSLLTVNLFDTSGYIILETKYNLNDFESEINRLSKLNITISDCKMNSFTNYIKYDENSYDYPSYITIDGFSNNYEYALIDRDNLKIIYIFLAYPDIKNEKYSGYLKKNKKEYLNYDNFDSYSIYKHSFDNNDSYYEFDDCN